MGRSGNPAKRAQQERVTRALAGVPGRPTRARFYCDESGNTGVHWGDPQQPIFVHGGWLVPQSSETSIMDDIANLRVSHRLSAPELKWKQLARRKDDSGVIFRGFLKAMVDHSCLPFFWVMDKDFITSAKVVETFFDPEYNEHYPKGFTAAHDVKKELAEAVSRSVDVRQRFADLMRAGERPAAEEVRDLATRLANHLQAGNAPRFADSLRDFSDHAIAEIQDELGAETWMRTTVGHSLWALMQHVETFIREHPVELEIVHDNLVRYEPAFDLLRGMFRPSDGTDFTFIGGQRVWYSMPTVTGLHLADSRSEPMIQMADLLCGFVRTVFTKIKKRQELTPDELIASSHLAMFREEWFVWDGNLPQEMWQQFECLAIGAGREIFRIKGTPSL